MPGQDEILIGSGRYFAAATDAWEQTAEVGFIVQEDYHNLGIASRLLTHLADIARKNGIASRLLCGELEAASEWRVVAVLGQISQHDSVTL